MKLLIGHSILHLPYARPGSNVSTGQVNGISFGGGAILGVEDIQDFVAIPSIGIITRDNNTYTVLLLWRSWHNGRFQHHWTGFDSSHRQFLKMNVYFLLENTNEDLLECDSILGF